MCCFTRAVEVSGTKIFVRPLDFGRQAVVYSMKIDAAEAGAMVLPLPVAKGAGEKALRFHDLSDYPEFFSDLHRGFRERTAGGAQARTLSNAAPTLEVVSLGAFEASYVPSPADFARLDERFRLPTEVLASVPEWQGRGFAVFKLRSGRLDVHPMAFDFPMQEPQRSFFPTVHVHDGAIHAKAKFDHTLYLQPNGRTYRELPQWRESSELAGEFVAVERTKDLVLPNEHVYRLEIRGKAPNRDQWLGVPSRP